MPLRQSSQSTFATHRAISLQLLPRVVLVAMKVDVRVVANLLVVAPSAAKETACAMFAHVVVVVVVAKSTSTTPNSLVSRGEDALLTGWTQPAALTRRD